MEGSAAHSRPARREQLLFRADGSDRARLVEPGDWARRCAPRSTRWLTLRRDPDEQKQLRTTRRRRPCGPRDRAEGRVPEIEKMVSVPTSNSFVPGPASVRSRNWDAGDTLAGGEKRELAGMRDRRDLHPGAQPGPRHVLDHRREGHSRASLVRRIGRPRDLPRGEWGTLLDSDRRLCRRATPRTEPFIRATGHNDARRRAASTVLGELREA